MEVTIKTKASGPVFNGEAQRLMNAYTDDAEQEVADYGVTEIHRELHVVLRNPTGYYESQIQTERASPTLVTDGNVIYGAWLEGVGSRNKTTRFKGYFTFRRVTQRVQAKAIPIAELVLKKYLRRMN